MLDASSVRVPVTIQLAPDCAALVACSRVLIPHQQLNKGLPLDLQIRCILDQLG